MKLLLLPLMSLLLFTACEQAEKANTDDGSRTPDYNKYGCDDLSQDSNSAAVYCPDKGELADQVRASLDKINDNVLGSELWSIRFEYGGGTIQGVYRYNYKFNEEEVILKAKHLDQAGEVLEEATHNISEISILSDGEKVGSVEAYTKGYTESPEQVYIDLHNECLQLLEDSPVLALGIAFNINGSLKNCYYLKNDPLYDGGIWKYSFEKPTLVFGGL
jgi:hypothetical protein